MKNPIICVDFDGVIHSYKSGWQGVATIQDDPVPGAIDWLMEHLPVPEALGGCFAPDHTGPIVQIYSSRSKSWFGRRAMKNWLVKHGLPRSYITDGILQFPSKKPAAFLTIDDRAICFNGKFPTSEEMMAFKPWNKREYPHGQLTPEDEGQLAVRIGSENGAVKIDFGKETAWVGMPPEQAIEFAAIIHKHAAAMLGQPH